MKNWIKDRSREPTTYLAISQLILGLGGLLKVSEAPAVADSVAQAAGALSAGDYTTGAVLVVSGLLGIVMREKGKR